MGARREWQACSQIHSRTNSREVHSRQGFGCRGRRASEAKTRTFAALGIAEWGRAIEKQGKKTA
jgi:hypothetical protein